ncbi:response regulator [Brevundimonas sp. S30B]|uniref:hybrid sensor histidine kinase/response regulator n=1 Tax=unclassified Brevundimonas TaxID=2622653 RepID=UPI001072BE84|nr:MULTISPECIES: response regulator [unclassified Brevundimonas]QBX38090.1 response regulator [Brevundimonas sp. MF30-B]TFW02556.1 response regulator [Brevundimonas sp. S30B]
MENAALDRISDGDNEQRRLDMVRSLGLAGRAPDAGLSAIVALAADLSAADVGVVGLLDADVLWIIGAHGVEPSPVDRRDSFCDHVLQSPNEIVWVEDTLNDARFASNRYVVEAPAVRFYVGAPLRVNGCAVGALSLAGPAPRTRDEVVVRRLRLAAEACEAELADRHRGHALRQALTASADALIDCDEEGVVLSWSGGAERLFGHPASEAVGSEITLIIPPAFRDRHRAGMAQWRRSGAARLGRRLELPAVRRDGSELDIELWMSVTHDGGRTRIHANIRDISERRAQARELAAAKSSAEAADQAKTAFLATMSHELRTPLNGISACAGLLASADLPSEERKLVDILAGAADQLGRLIDDVLDIARGDAGELKLDPAPTDIGQTLEEVTELFRSEAQGKGLTLTATIPDDVRRVAVTDRTRLKQVLGNLLSNAVKFTQVGSVSLTATRDGDVVRFEVADTGIGIAPEAREIIFDRFQQADGTITRRFGGSGLGLSIARDLVRALGGELECVSTPDSGSIFGFALRLEVVETSEASPSSDERAVTTGALRILVVDDHPTNRQVAGLMLQSFGFATSFAEDGRQALQSLRTEPFDLVLMDMMMPVMDGLEATRRLRRGDAGQQARSIPVIMLTANTLPQHRADAIAAGADEHLAKPITPGRLLAAVEGRMSESSRRTPTKAGGCPVDQRKP